jgi:hypothetical protein
MLIDWGVDDVIPVDSKAIVGDITFVAFNDGNISMRRTCDCGKTLFSDAVKKLSDVSSIIKGADNRWSKCTCGLPASKTAYVAGLKQILDTSETM